jgi:hypothetical protein
MDRITYRGQELGRTVEVRSFNCYPSGAIILAQLGVFPAQARD